jgi:hypothetical protein
MSLLSTSHERRGSLQRPPLRLLRGGSTRTSHGPTPAGADGPSPLVGLGRPTSVRSAAQRSRILVAGADAEQRAAVLRDLSESLPADTPFGEAGAAWEVLEQAPSSGVVMLAGDLDEVTAESLMNVLGHRHPSLPVVALGLCADRGPVGGSLSPGAASAAG